MTFWWNSNHIWLCAEIGRTGWSQTSVLERACGFDSHQSYFVFIDECWVFKSRFAYYSRENGQVGIVRLSRNCKCSHLWLYGEIGSTRQI